jgi:predicted nucleotidyltransferase
MNLQQMLETRVTERSAFVRLIAPYLENDTRVRAAWLSGSLAKGNHDALSDIDVWIVVDDESLRQLFRDFATGLSKPSLVMDNINNEPPQGAYLLVHYPDEFGPQHVDWFWQPESLATCPDDALMLFNRADLKIVSWDKWRDEMHQSGGGSPINEVDQASILTFKVKFSGQ